MKEDFNPAPLQLLSISYDIETCETLTSHFNPDEKLIDHSRRNKETKNPRNLWSLPPDFKIAHFFPHGFKVKGEHKQKCTYDFWGLRGSPLREKANLLHPKMNMLCSRGFQSVMWMNLA
ncbi:hypothetical protein C5167_029588 [Papaver somniferum]|nr:hypothetical protein C5167_029588 [Papaver somniferum]